MIELKVLVGGRGTLGELNKMIGPEAICLFAHSGGTAGGQRAAEWHKIGGSEPIRDDILPPMNELYIPLFRELLGHD